MVRLISQWWDVHSQKNESGRASVLVCSMDMLPLVWIASFIGHHNNTRFILVKYYALMASGRGKAGYGCM